MSPSVQLGLPPTIVEQINPRGLKSSTLPILRICRDALRRADIKRSFVASLFRQSEQLLSEQLSDEERHEHRHLSLRKLGKLERAFWREFALLLCDELGISTQAALEQQRKSEIQREKAANLAVAASEFLRVAGQ